jgi:hypothetical protein
MAENVLSYEDRVLDSMMDKAFEKAGVDDYSFSEELKRIYRGHIESYPGVDDFFSDLAYGGCRSGMMGEFVYTDDCKEFYLKHMDDLEAYKRDIENDLGESITDDDLTHPELVTWLVVEEVARRVSDELEDSLDEAISEELGELSPDNKEMILDSIQKEEIREKTEDEMESIWDYEEDLPELTLEVVASEMDDQYHLFSCDPRDNLNDYLNTFQECIESHSKDALYEVVDQATDDQIDEAVYEVISELKSKLEEKGYPTDEVVTFFQEYEGEIVDEIHVRDVSEPLEQLVNNTGLDGQVCAYIDMTSSFDCVNSYELESEDGFAYKNTYFGDMIDQLNLNPSKVEELLHVEGAKTVGVFPDISARDGQEFVRYDQFVEELVNNPDLGLLVFLTKVDLKDLVDKDFDVQEVVVPKGNRCGLFFSGVGSGSLLGMELQRDIKLDVRHEEEGRRMWLTLDDKSVKRGCSIQETYDFAYPDKVFGRKAELSSNEALRAVGMKYLFDKQIVQYGLNPLERCAFVNYQPVKVKDGWIQRGTSDLARLFKTDPSNIRDEVYTLAQERAVALTELAHDSAKWRGLEDLISIKPETPHITEKESAGMSQSLSVNEKKSNGMKM